MTILFILMIIGFIYLTYDVIQDIKDTFKYKKIKYGNSK